MSSIHTVLRQPTLSLCLSCDGEGCWLPRRSSSAGRWIFTRAHEKLADVASKIGPYSSDSCKRDEIQVTCFSSIFHFPIHTSHNVCNTKRQPCSQELPQAIEPPISSAEDLFDCCSERWSRFCGQAVPKDRRVCAADPWCQDC